MSRRNKRASLKSKEKDVETPMEVDGTDDLNQPNDPIQTSVSRGFNPEGIDQLSFQNTSLTVVLRSFVYTYIMVIYSNSMGF